MAVVGNPAYTKCVFFPDQINNPKVPGDPAGTVTCTIEDPRGTKTTYTYGVDPGFTHTASTGVFYFTFTPAISGLHLARWASSPGSGQAADEVAIPVQASRL